MGGSKDYLCARFSLQTNKLEIHMHLPCNSYRVQQTPQKAATKVNQTNVMEYKAIHLLYFPINFTVNIYQFQ